MEVDETPPTETSSEELDQLDRSTKKQKGGSSTFTPQRHLRSYKDSLVCPEGIREEQNFTFIPAPMEDEISDDEVVMDDDYPTILLSKAEKIRIQAPWRSALIIKAIGKSVGFKYMDFKIRSLWKPQGDMQMIDLGLDFFLIRFKLADDYWKVVNGGPWFVKQQFLSVRCWSPGFRPSEAKITTTAVWLRLPELPIELYDSGLLRRVGNQLGKLLKIDARTVDSERGRYARLCIQIDLDQPLAPKVRIGHILQRVQYEGISTICFECGCVGHKLAACPTKILPNHQTTPVAAMHGPVSQTENTNHEKYGEWMLVTRKQSFAGKKKIVQTPSGSPSFHRSTTVHGVDPKEGKNFQSKKFTNNIPQNPLPSSGTSSIPAATSDGDRSLQNDTTNTVSAVPINKISSNRQPKPIRQKSPDFGPIVALHQPPKTLVHTPVHEKPVATQSPLPKAMPLTSENKEKIPLDEVPTLQHVITLAPGSDLLVNNMDLESDYPVPPSDSNFIIPNVVGSTGVKQTSVIEAQENGSPIPPSSTSLQTDFKPLSNPSHPECPNLFWRQVEEAMERSLRDQIPQLPPNTQFGRIIVNLTTDLAIVSPTMMLQLGLPPRWRDPRAVIREALPGPTIPHGTEMNSESTDVEVHEVLTSIISLESTLLFLPFLANHPTIMVIEVHQRVLSFQLSIDLIPEGNTQDDSYRVVVNPQTRVALETFRDYRRRDAVWRRRSSRTAPAPIHNSLSMKILLWNCRGAGNPNFRRNFAALMNYHHPAIVALVETRISGQRAVSVSSSLGFDSVVRSDAIGFSGGIWLLWDSTQVQLDILSVSTQVIHASVQVNSSSTLWLFSAIYASTSFDSRLELWDHLANFSGTHSLPWMVAGDFNDILSSHEKFSATPASQRRMTAFKNCLDSCNLLDLGFNGPRFTWTNKRPNGLVMERLDRVLCNPSWKQCFEEANVLHLPRVSSDHNPILIDLCPPQHVFGPRPFRLETIWFSDPSFPSLVKDAWGCFPHNVNLAIKDFSNRARLWNREVFGNIFHKKKRLLARLNGIQRSLSHRPCAALLDLEKDLSYKYQNILRLEEEFWALKSRLHWSTLGDRNTSFFHLSTICRRHRNKIWCLKDAAGNWSNSATELKNIIQSYFVQLYKTDTVCSTLVPPYQVHCNTLTNEEKSLLDIPISREEILRAFKSFKPLKAPGPDGLHPIFFQNFWDIIGDSTSSFIQDIFRLRVMPTETNGTLVCLIPKVAKPESVHQFRPIGLCNTLYKAVTKILVLRLKPILSNLIHPLQASFIPGRKASDNVIMVQEIIHSMSTSRSKVGNMALKIDLEKAYDRLEWSFIRHTLHFFNFPQAWIDLIMSCISSASLSILVNGERLEKFYPTRGIRQGDPLSPYIFILCMEYLACLIHEETIQGNWTGVKTSRNGPSFTHLFFADDLILFAKATKKNCIAINRVLEMFCSASGQKVNLAKSKIFLPTYLDHSRFGFLESELGLKIARSFGKYLGVPIIVDGRDKRAFDFILEKVRDKLAGWKAKTLSLAGRCTLIQAVTTSIPTHVMQCTMLPGKICTELDKLNRNFLWGDTLEKKKLHLIKWDLVTSPKEEGGLGLKQAGCRNKALLAKRNWDFISGSTDVWANVFRRKYPPDRHMRGRCSSIWRSLNYSKNLCDKGKRWVIQNGKTINFWHDNWLDPGPLRQLISGPLLPHESEQKICELWDSHGEWDLRHLSFQLPDDITRLISATSRPITPILEDSFCWKPTSNGQFSSKSAYLIAAGSPSTKQSPTGWKWLWKINTIPRVLSFLWLSCHERLPTKVFLFRRNITPDNLCPLCKTEPESLMHALRDCSLVKPVWLSIGSSPPPDFSTSLNTKAWIKQWSTSTLATTFHTSILWKDVFPLLTWSIWSSRNKLAMEGVPFIPTEVVKKAKSLAIEFFFSLPCKGTALPKSTTLIGWQHPPTGYAKLNTDGSVLGNPGPASSGGLLRDCNGNWIGGFSHKLGITNSLAAELWGIRDGLLLARDLNIRKLIVESDAKSVVELLKPVASDMFGSHPYSALINDCRFLIQSFEEATIQHAHRESNFCADLLAKEGHNLVEPFYVFSYPPHFVLFTKTGIALPR
uniref:Reverse transcriptase domain-containing protein n=1 Tax=Fagus sylvatica TaxID=28930 RepID=A0A2N9FQ21_FAGSY